MTVHNLTRPSSTLLLFKKVTIIELLFFIIIIIKTVAVFVRLSNEAILNTWNITYECLLYSSFCVPMKKEK